MFYEELKERYNPKHKNKGEVFCNISRRFYPKWVGWGVLDEYASKGVNLRQIDVDTDELLKKYVDCFYEEYYAEPVREMFEGFAQDYSEKLIFLIAVYMGKKALKKAKDRYVGIGDFNQYLILEYLEKTNYAYKNRMIDMDEYKKSVNRALHLHYIIQRNKNV